MYIGGRGKGNNQNSSSTAVHDGPPAAPKGSQQINHECPPAAAEGSQQVNGTTKQQWKRKEKIWGSIKTITAVDILNVGLTYVGFDPEWQRGVRNVITKDGQSKQLKEFLARVKNREQTLHTRLKAFSCLENWFGHGSGTEDKMKLHGECVTAITVMAVPVEELHPYHHQKVGKDDTQDAAMPDQLRLQRTAAWPLSRSRAPDPVR